ncbi:MAG: penicillin-binding transpeptidase domain-containing protein, partial [Dehalococcoidia bacterium]
FDEVNRFGLALTLGGGEVRLLELTAAYAAFANGGYRAEPVIITRVEDSKGQVLAVGPQRGLAHEQGKIPETAPGPQVMDERVAYLITDILSDNFARASTFGEGSPLRLSRPAAAKTGTTTDWRDNWTVGYTPDLVIGVWAGNADNEPMRHVSGVIGAAPIWHDVMEALHRGRPVREFVEPPGMVRMEVCADSGLPPAQPPTVGGQPSTALQSPFSNLSRQLTRCPRTITELFIEGAQPTRTDDWHWLFTLDARNGLLAGPDCPSQFTTERLYTLYPSEAQDWARRQSIPQPPEAYSPLCPDQGSGIKVLAPDPRFLSPDSLIPASLILTSPDQGSRYRLSPEIPREMQKVPVDVRPADGITLHQVTLLADGRPLATLTRPPYRTLWPMTAGRHIFTAIGLDAEGNELEGNSIMIKVTE